MSADLLDRALDELVERCDDAFGDWSDVLHRAGISNGAAAAPVRAGTIRRRVRHPRLIVVLALFGIVVAVLLATPAFGVRHFILDVIGGRTDVPFKRTKPAPTIVRRQFADLGFGAPPSLAPQAIVGESRTVTTFRGGGKRHTLWVAPTRRGGFCWTVSEAFGGCLDRAELSRGARRYKPPRGAVHPELLSISYLASSPRSSVPATIEGVVLAPKTVRLTAEFRDGTSVSLPFVFVSPPIDAGFVYWAIPGGQRQRATALEAVTARDAHGKVLARSLIPLVTQRRVRIRPRPATAVTAPPPSPLGFHIPNPAPPLQHGSGDGATVTVGTNGVAVFDTTGVGPNRRPLLAGRLGVGCFKIEHDRLGIWPRELEVPRGFGPTIKVRLFGVPHPYDGCEIQGAYGHTWPDRLGSHSAVEIPLTPTGRTYFADRAAARDLALFVRSRELHRIRRLSGDALATAISRRYGSKISRLASLDARLSPGRIGYATRAGETTFLEYSERGRRFIITVKDGRIVRQNVKPLAFVF